MTAERVSGGSLCSLPSRREESRRPAAWGGLCASLRSAREWMGIEPTRRRANDASTALKAAGPTRWPDTPRQASCFRPEFSVFSLQCSVLGPRAPAYRAEPFEKTSPRLRDPPRPVRKPTNAVNPPTPAGPSQSEPRGASPRSIAVNASTLPSVTVARRPVRAAPVRKRTDAVNPPTQASLRRSEPRGASPRSIAVNASSFPSRLRSPASSLQPAPRRHSHFLTFSLSHFLAAPALRLTLRHPFPKVPCLLRQIVAGVANNTTSEVQPWNEHSSSSSPTACIAA